MRRITILLLALFVTASFAATEITSTGFDSSSQPGWFIGSTSGGSIEYPTTGCHGGAACLKGNYPIASGSGGSYVYASYSIPLASNITSLYFDFWAKKPNGGTGLKFVKIFGEDGQDGGYSHFTFALNYGGTDNGSLHEVTFGDGTGIANDGTNIIRLDGLEPELAGRSYPDYINVETPQNDWFHASEWNNIGEDGVSTWHHFRLGMKFNSGTTAANEVPDGTIYVEIDGKVYLNVTGLYDRHYSNLPITKFTLLGWSQGGTTAFDVWYDDFTVSTGGFLDEGGIPVPTYLRLIKQP